MKNYNIHLLKSSAGIIVFSLKDNLGEDYLKMECEINTVLDFDIKGEVFRIELLYFPGVIQSEGISISGKIATLDSKYVLQIGTNKHLSLIMRADSIYLGPSSHVPSIAYLLCDSRKSLLGIEIRTPSRVL